MAKSNRQRKRDREIRQAKAAREREAALRRQISEAAVQQAHKLLDRMYDPATPADELARLLTEHYDGAPVMPGLTDLLLSKGSSPERLVKVSELLQASEAAEGGQPSLTTLTFAAAAAREAGDTGQARRLLDDALRQAGDPSEAGDPGDAGDYGIGCG